MSLALPQLRNRDRVHLVEPGRLHPAISFTRSTTATYIGADGLFKVAAINEPRFEYSPAGVYLGLLMEESRTNLAVNSVMAGGGAAPTGWSQTIGTGTSAPVASNLGNADGAVAYSQTATAQRPFIERSATTVASTVYTLSFYVEAVSGGLTNAQILAINGISPTTFRANGVTVLSTAAAVVGRLEAVFTTTGTSTGLRIGIGGGGNATGSVQFSRPQIELGSFATAYIPTTTVTVTRGTENTVVSNLSGIDHNQAEGTFFAETDSFGRTVGGFPPICSFGVSSDRYDMFYNGTSLIGSDTRVGGVGQAALSVGAIAGFNKAVRAYAVANSCVAVNGSVTQMSGGTGAIPTVSAFYIGQNAAGSSRLNGHIRRMWYSRRRHPNVDSAVLTA